MARLAIALLLVCLARPGVGQAPKPKKADPPPDPNAPYPAVDAGGHAGEVWGVAFTPDGKSVVTAAADRTVRVWDLVTGDTVRMFRLPAAPEGGTLNALALSPDGKTAAVGGSITARRRTEGPIYLIDLAAGRVVRTLDDHLGPITSLSFGPGGKRLASGSADGTARVFDTATGKATAVFRDHKAPIFRVAFAPDGDRVASTAMDLRVRVWPAAGGAADLVLADPPHPAAGVAWSPDGKRLAAGNQDGSVTVWNAAGKRLFTHVQNKRAPAWAIAFTPDGEQVLCAGTPRKEAEDEVVPAARLVDVVTGQEGTSVGLHTGPVRGVAVSPDGKLAATCGGRLNEAYVWRTEDGSVVRTLRARSAAPDAVGWSPDGRSIAWGMHRLAEDPEDDIPLERTFHLGDLRPGPAPDGEFRRAVRTRKGRTLLWGGHQVSVRDADDEVTSFLLTAGTRVSCATWVDDDLMLVGTQAGPLLMNAGTGTVVRRFSGSGGEVASVALAPDEVTFVTGGRDQVLRVWVLDKPRPLLSVLAAGEDWVAWTDEGVYAGTAGGERLAGWQVGTGPDGLAPFHPLARFRPSLYRPEVVRHAASTGGLAEAFAAAKVARPDRLAVEHLLPPTAEVTAPAAGSTLTGTRFEVSATARPTAGRRVSGVRLLVDGRPYGGRAGVRAGKDGGAAEVKATWAVDLPPGPHTLAVAADIAVSRGVSAPVEVRVPGAEERPALYVLAVGVGETAGRKFAADAEAVSGAFRDHGKKAFRAVEARALKDKDATRAGVEAGLAWLAEKATARDVAVFAFTGQWARDARWAPALVTADGDPKDAARAGLPAARLTAALAEVPGRLLVILDAGPADDLARELVGEECGAAVLSAGAGPAGGAFAQALAEGLGGKADRDQDGAVWLHELTGYTTFRVRVLTDGAQTPVTVRPAGGRSFLLARP